MTLDIILSPAHSYRERLAENDSSYPAVTRMYSNSACCDSADSGFAWHYNEYFDIVRANSPALLDEAYRLRYQVYCLEHPFENAAEHSDGRERDEDDDRSVHSLLVHRQTGVFAGTVRAILPKEVQRRPLPIHRILASQ